MRAGARAEATQSEGEGDWVRVRGHKGERTDARALEPLSVSTRTLARDRHSPNQSPTCPPTSRLGVAGYDDRDATGGTSGQTTADQRLVCIVNWGLLVSTALLIAGVMLPAITVQYEFSKHGTTNASSFDQWRRLRAWSIFYHCHRHDCHDCHDRRARHDRHDRRSRRD